MTLYLLLASKQQTSEALTIVVLVVLAIRLIRLLMGYEDEPPSRGPRR